MKLTLPSKFLIICNKISFKESLKSIFKKVIMTKWQDKNKKENALFSSKEAFGLKRSRHLQPLVLNR